MQFIKLIFDDFYKFIMSCGIILLLTGMGFLIMRKNNPHLIIGIVLILIALIIICWSGYQWYQNDKERKEQLKMDTKIKKLQLAKLEEEYAQNSKIKSKKDVKTGKAKKKSLSIIKFIKPKIPLYADQDPVRFENEVKNILYKDFKVVEYLGKAYHADLAIELHEDWIPVEIKGYFGQLPLGAIFQLKAFMDYNEEKNAGIIITRGEVSDYVKEKAENQNIYIIHYADILIEQNRLSQHIKNLLNKHFFE